MPSETWSATSLPTDAACQNSLPKSKYKPTKYKDSLEALIHS